MSPKPPKRSGKGGPGKKRPRKPPGAGFDIERLAKLRPDEDERAARARRKAKVSAGIGPKAKIAASERAQAQREAAAAKRRAKEAAGGRPKEPGKPKVVGIADLPHRHLKRAMRDPEAHGLVRMLMPDMRTLVAMPGRSHTIPVGGREGLTLTKTVSRTTEEGKPAEMLFTLTYAYPSAILRRPKTMRVVIDHKGKIISRA